MTKNKKKNKNSYVYLRAEKTDEIILYILLRHYDADLLALGIGVFIRPVLTHKQRPDRAAANMPHPSPINI